MTDPHKSGQPIVATIGLILFFLFLCVLIFFTVSVSASGSATLPNGVIVEIRGGWGFGVSETGKKTEVEIGGRLFEFTETIIVVDGVKVGDIDESVTQMSLSMESGRVILKADGKVVELPD